MTPIELLNTQIEVFQLLTVAFAICGLVIEAYQFWADPKSRSFIIPTVFWLAHTLVFYVAFELDRYVGLDIFPLFGSYTVWSSILRLQIVGTVILIEFFRVALRDLKHKLELAKLTKLAEETHAQVLKEQGYLLYIKDLLIKEEINHDA